MYLLSHLAIVSKIHAISFLRQLVYHINSCRDAAVGAREICTLPHLFAQGKRPRRVQT
jgi:hypothetical protein